MVAERIESRPVAWYLDRLAAHLRECNRRYPQAWRQIDRLRAVRAELGNWPEWCFCPLSGPYAVVAEKYGVDAKDLHRIDVGSPVGDVCKIGALAAWRTSQGVYLIDPTVLEAVMDTPVDGKLPVDILMQLPEWCCYVPTPGHSFEEYGLIGFFAHLEEDSHDRRIELRIVLDLDGMPPWEALTGDMLHLIWGGTFDDGYAAVLAEIRKHNSPEKLRPEATAAYLEAERNTFETARERIAPLISVLLYLCSQTAEYRAATERVPGRPSNPTAKKTKEGWRLFPPDRPKIWCVGETIGKTIRDAMTKHREHDEHRMGPRPHVRRAHWHSFWTGPKSEPAARKLVLKWLPPMPIAMEEDTPEARMRRAKTKPIKSLGSEIAAAAAELEGHRGDVGETD